MRILLVILIAISCTGCFKPLLNFDPARRSMLRNKDRMTSEYEPFSEVDLNVAQAMQKQSALTERQAKRSREAQQIATGSGTQTTTRPTTPRGSLLSKDQDQTERILNLIEQTDDELLKRILAEKIPGNGIESENEPGKNRLTLEERRSAERIASAQANSTSFGSTFADTPSFKPSFQSTPVDASVDWTEIEKTGELDPAAQRGDFIDDQPESNSVVPAGASTASFATKPAVSATKTEPAKLQTPDNENTLSAATVHSVSSKKRTQHEPIETASSWQSELESTIAQLESSLQNNKFDETDQATRQVYLRLLHLIGSNDQKATSRIAGLNETEQEFWQSQMQALSLLLETKNVDPSATFRASPGAETEVAVAHLRQAIKRLSAEASLQVRNVALCREVIGFGQYETFKTYDFQSNQNVLIYCELENFVTVRQSNSNLYETEFRGSYTVLDEANEVVHRHEYSSVSDSGRRQRRDFYMYFPMAIPELPPGSYSLQLEVEDLKGNKSSVSQKPVRFAIH